MMLIIMSVVFEFKEEITLYLLEEFLFDEYN